MHQPAGIHHQKSQKMYTSSRFCTSTPFESQYHPTKLQSRAVFSAIIRPASAVDSNTLMGVEKKNLAASILNAMQLDMMAD